MRTTSGTDISNGVRWIMVACFLAIVVFAVHGCGSSGPGASIAVKGCGLNYDGTAYANLAITNTTSNNSDFFVDVGFYQDGKEFDDANDIPDISAGSTYDDTINSIDQVPDFGTVSCKVLEVDREK